MGMKRSTFPVLIALLLSGALLQAQRGGGSPGGSGMGFHGGGFHGGVGNGGRPVVGPGRGFHGFNRHRGFGFGNAGFWPPYWGYWDDGLAWDLGYWDYVNFPPSGYAARDAYAQAADEPSPHVVVRESRQSAAVPSEAPKLVEVPLSPGAPAVRQGPALFVLSNGERLESRHYVLTADSLRIQVGRQQRTVPVSALDVDATIAANQQRGIELTIPQDRNSLFLGF